ncbi:hypothetical protein [Olleya namhaensis]|uniref:Uncharacterized protein n=1 Tax=Olleya namhaensis TaxID=1144750 RepID=A0A1I3MTG9_9FLAO|nr:hypothetical protein [Olleya namhaensis]SFJ00313.1 hypothetical protein SAMN05443431_103299 [Olleya namhaensis]
MKKIIIDISVKLVLVSFFISCASKKNHIREVIDGVYIQTDNRRIELHFENNSFFLKDNFEPTHLAIQEYICCDTIAYGNWSYVDNQNFLSLSSPEELSTFYLNLDVTEKHKDSKDITFVIDNPIERSHEKKGASNELLYSISITKQNGEVMTKTSINRIIKIEDISEISMFEIIVYPKCDIPLRDLASKEIFTIPYDVKKANTNLFNIDIPMLNYKYLSLKRLDKDYVRVKNKNILIWDGKEYVKK